MMCGSLRVAFAIRILIGACVPVIVAEGAFAQTAPVELGTIEVQSNTESATGPVDGYIATRTATGAKTDTPIQEIPQSITVVTADRMKDMGTTTMQEAFRYVPGVFADPYGPDSRVDGPTVRGIDVDTYLDGMRTTNSWFNYQRVDPYTLERAEVLRGPGSVLYGAASVGGLINLVTKRPQAQDLHEIGVQYGSFNRKQIQTDHTGKITANGDWLYRVIGVFRDSDYQTDYVKDDRVLVMPMVRWRPTNMTDWTIMATYQKDKTGSSTGFLPHSGTLLYNPNGRIPINRFAGDPATDLYQTETKSITSLFEHRFSDAFKVGHSIRYQDIDGIYNSVYSNSFSANPYLDPAQRTVTRYVDWSNADRKILTSDSNAELKVLTGPLSHKVLVGFDYRRMSETGQAGGYLDMTPFDLYAPVYSAILPPTMFDTADIVQKQAGVYVQDQVRWGSLIGTYGLRYDRATNMIEGSPTQTNKAVTGRAGLMYELPFGLTPYVSYSQSFTPLTLNQYNLCNDKPNGLCEPVRGEQYEVGFKYRQGNVTVNGAVFDITQKNRTASDPSGAYGSVQIGKARIRGAELEVLATVMENLDLIGAYTYLDARVLSGDNAGSHIETVPEHQASLWAKYRFARFGMPGLSAGAGVRYIGAVWDGYDTLKTPGYTLYDAMIAWENKEWRFQLNGTNLGDKEYFTACLARGDCFYGTGRTILAQLTYRFSADRTQTAAKP